MFIVHKREVGGLHVIKLEFNPPVAGQQTVPRRYSLVLSVFNIIVCISSRVWTTQVAGSANTCSHFMYICIVLFVRLRFCPCGCVLLSIVLFVCVSVLCLRFCPFVFCVLWAFGVLVWLVGWYSFVCD